MPVSLAKPELPPRAIVQCSDFPPAIVRIQLPPRPPVAGFTDGFASWVYQGETITCEVDGFTATATIYSDDDTDAPWLREDGHGPVSEWRRGKGFHHNGNAKRAGELLLSELRGGAARFYDFAEAVRIAKRDGWGAPAGTFRDDATPSKGQVAAAAAMADFERLKAWCDGEWEYVGLAVTVSRNGIELVGSYDHALWGIESDASDYLTEVANELLPDAHAAARAAIVTLTA